MISAPLQAASTSSSGYVSCPPKAIRAPAIISTAESPRSTIISWRRSIESASTPAGSASTTNGENQTALASVTPDGDPVSSSATQPTAVMPTQSAPEKVSPLRRNQR